MTTGGREAMMPAEARASDDSALIFSPIIRRARSTADRLPSASARLPPVFCWMAMTMVKKRNSEVGIRPYIFSNACSRVRPTPRPSTNVWNSGPSGAGLSRAMILKHSWTGRPDLMPRTITSTALGNSSENFFIRDLPRKPTTQRGRPRPKISAIPTTTRIGKPKISAPRPVASPTTAEMM